MNAAGQPAPRPKRTRTSITFTDPSQTKQAERAGTTIDAVLKRYALLGLNPAQQRDIFAAGLATAPFGIQRAHDYQRELNQVIAVQNYFDNLPATTRDKFQNDPHAMLTWLADHNNHDEARKLKLLPEKPAGASATPPTAPPTPPNTTGEVKT